MLGGQTYIVSLLRRVQNWLNNNAHPAEASRVEKVMQKLSQAEDIDRALGDLHRVEGFGEFALRLMWLVQSAERGLVGLESGAMEHIAAMLGETLFIHAETSPDGPGPPVPPREVLDQMTMHQHRVGQVIEDIKRSSMPPQGFRHIDEDRLQNLLHELLPLGEQSADGSSRDLGRLAIACSAFVQYVIDHSLFHDVRVINILDNANLTLQTIRETRAEEDHDVVESTIQLLNQPKDLLA